jgi:hypothetical protein
MKTLNLTALLAGGTIALLPLNNLTDQLIAVAITFVALNAVNHLISRHTAK